MVLAQTKMAMRQRSWCRLTRWVTPLPSSSKCNVLRHDVDLLPGSGSVNTGNCIQQNMVCFHLRLENLRSCQKTWGLCSLQSLPAAAPGCLCPSSKPFLVCLQGAAGKKKGAAELLATPAGGLQVSPDGIATCFASCMQISQTSAWSKGQCKVQTSA